MDGTSRRPMGVICPLRIHTSPTTVMADCDQPPADPGLHHRVVIFLSPRMDGLCLEGLHFSMDAIATVRAVQHHTESARDTTALSADTLYSGTARAMS
ncbi:hypothetical protein ACOMHN_019602 [Nucella lapillus]